ncbi:MAG: TetR/AcrR family transcriptional regulator [Prevotella sp.]|nr:TetR/AcrR family transcriptional regulator [Prevotella sp.]
MNMFKQQGIKKVKMDDIAASLSISKRTLYEIYENKEQLLYEGMERDAHLRMAHLDNFALSAANEMEIVIEAIKIHLEDLSRINPLFFTELHKYKSVVTYHERCADENRKRSVEFIRKGVEHGFFLPDMNYEIVTRISDGVMKHVISTKMCERFSPRDIFVNYVCVVIRGICTEKGIESIDNLLRSKG